MKENTFSSGAAEGILIFDDSAKVVLCNNLMNTMFGYQGDELLGLPMHRLFVPVRSKVNEVFYKDLQRPASPERILRPRLYGIKKQGNRFNASVTISHFQGGDRSFTVLFLGQAKAKKNPMIFLILDVSGNFSVINDYGCRILGYDQERLAGRNWFDDFLPENEKSRVQSIYEDVLVNGHSENYKTPIVTQKGNSFTFDWITTAIYDAGGMPIAALSAGTEPVKETRGENLVAMPEKPHWLRVKRGQKMADTLANAESINRDLQLQIGKRKAIEKKLIKIQRLYDTMVRNFPGGVIGVLNRDMNYVLIDGKDINEIDLPAFGLKEQPLGQNVNPMLTDGTVSRLKRAFDGETVSCEVKTKNRFYNVTAVPLPDHKNTINEILCVIQNITERKEMEEGLLIALEKEKELGELKSRFVTMASHEFRTPLTTILSSTFLLENYAGTNYNREKIIHTSRIKRAVNSLTMILNEFLSLEKLEQNKVQVVNAEINIPEYISDLISEMDMVKKEGQHISYNHVGNLFRTQLDHQLLWSIVTNLISNALKYSKPHSNIHMTSEIKNQSLIISVSDQGIGIPYDEQQYIFGRFYRARNTVNIEGTGLGLHIAKKYVALMKGEISFRSQLDEGTNFTVILPDGLSKTAEVKGLKQKL